MANYTTGAQRTNARQNKIWEDAKRIERARVARGERPNPNLTDITPSFEAAVKLRSEKNTSTPADIAGSSFIVRDGQMISITPGTAVSQINDEEI